MYNLAAEISAMPSTELIAPLNRAVYPAYAQLANTRAKLLARFLEVYGLISLVAFPIAIGLFCVSHLVVGLLLGPKWIDAVPIMQILGLCGLVGALQGNMYVVMSAMGKPKANTLLSGSLLTVSLPAVVWASLQYGALGAAYAHFVAALLGLTGIVVVFTRVTGLPIYELIKVVWRPFIAATCMGLSIKGVQMMLLTSWSNNLIGVQLPAFVLFGAFIYVLTTLSLWTLIGRPLGAEVAVLTVMREKLQKYF